MSNANRVPGAVFIEDSALFNKLGDDQRINAPQKIPPSMSIGRAVFMESAHRFDWHETLDELGNDNYGRGNAKAYGSLAVTFVNAREMSHMLCEKKPKLFNDRPDHKGILNEYRKLTDRYCDFVRDNNKKVVDAQVNVVHCEELREEYERNCRAWGVGAFAVYKYPSAFGKNDLSVTFEEEDKELLHSEMKATWGFLRREGFNTNLIDHSRRPHISILNAHFPLAYVALKHINLPSVIELDRPKARVQGNSPTTPN